MESFVEVFVMPVPVASEVSAMTEYKLFVGNMPCDVTIAEVESAFSQFGPVVEIHMMDGARARSGQSSAFVKFDNMESCNQAILGMHMRGKLRSTDTDMLAVKFAKPMCSPGRSPSSEPSPSSFQQGSVIGVSGLLTFKSMMSSSCDSLGGSTTAASSPAITPLPSPISSGSRSLPSTSSSLSKLFVGGLPSYVNRDDLIAIFCPFGKVESVHLMSNNKSKSGQSCAFINFYSKDSARIAIDSLNGIYKIEEHGNISVRFADNTEDDAGRIVKRVRPTPSLESLLAV